MANTGKQLPKRECPLCGESYGNLPLHMDRCQEEKYPDRETTACPDCGEEFVNLRCHTSQTSCTEVDHDE